MCKECRWTETQTYLFSFVNKYHKKTTITAVTVVFVTSSGFKPETF